MKALLDAQIVSNEEICSGIYLLKLKLPYAIEVQPGQFLQLKLKEEQFLRRPFSIFDQQRDELSILYKVRGTITAKLSTKSKGDSVNIIYPLGKGFEAPSKPKVLLVAGGTGFAPLNFFAHRYLSKDSQEVKFLIGTAGKEATSFAEFLKDLKIDVSIATEDGSVGKKGKVTDLLGDIQISGDCLLYAAGPLDMLKQLHSHIGGKLKAYFSLERHFACGLGFCWGCVVPTKDGYKRVCKEGPVFDADLILWGRV